jgi:hypothetical protein
MQYCQDNKSRLDRYTSCQPVNAGSISMWFDYWPCRIRHGKLCRVRVRPSIPRHTRRNIKLRIWIVSRATQGTH